MVGQYIETGLQSAGISKHPVEGIKEIKDTVNSTGNLFSSINWWANGGNGADVKSQASVSGGIMSVEFSYGSLQAWAYVEATLPQAIGDNRYMKITYRSNFDFFMQFDTDGPNEYDDMRRRLDPSSDWRTEVIDLYRIGPPTWMYQNTNIIEEPTTISSLRGMSFTLGQIIPKSGVDPKLEIKEIVFYERGATLIGSKVHTNKLKKDGIRLSGNTIILERQNSFVAKLSVVDIKGREVFKSYTDKRSCRFNLGKLSNGVYCAILKEVGGIKRKSIITLQ